MSLAANIQFLVEQKLVRKSRHPTLDLTIFNYTEQTQFKKLWTEETKMCRGLVLDDPSNLPRGRSGIVNTNRVSS
ncbi:MAG: hypothetical protein EOP45_15895, partial [Sphingobacteriaceae bacterium]